MPMSRRYHKLIADNDALAVEIAEWKKKVGREWENVTVDSLTLPDKSKQIISLGKSYVGKVLLDIGDLSIDDVGVELIVTEQVNGKMVVRSTYDFAPISFENGKALYSVESLRMIRGCLR